MQFQHHEVVGAVQQLIHDQVGRLPPQHFHVHYAAKTEDLAELLKFFMYHGYALRNAQNALEEQQRMLTAGFAGCDAHQQHYALPIMTQCCDNLTVQDAYGSNLSKVSGEVSQWHPHKGEIKCDAVQYIKQLESQNRLLQDTVSTQLYVNAVHNPLLTYLNTLPIDKKRTTWYVSDDSKEAISDFIHTLMGTDCIYEDDRSQHEFKDLRQLLLYCMVVGYLLRQEEMMICFLSS